MLRAVVSLSTVHRPDGGTGHGTTRAFDDLPKVVVGSVSSGSFCGRPRKYRRSVRPPTIGGVKLLRYRRPSLQNLTGYTRVRRQAKRELGISQVQAWTRPSRVKQRAKQHVGYYSPTMRLVRNAAKGRFPSFLGLFCKK
jgi:hypothetical protein